MDWAQYCAVKPLLEAEGVDGAIADLCRWLDKATRNAGFAAALQVVAGTQPQYSVASCAPASLVRQCRKTAPHSWVPHDGGLSLRSWQLPLRS